MPHQTWKHRCKASEDQSITIGVQVCPDCNEAGEYDGLGLTGIEAQGNFNRLTGLTSIGPHKQRLPHFYEQCPACLGRSVIVLRNDVTWVNCRSCNGTGGIITVSEKRFIEIQKKAWSVFDAWRLERASETTRIEIESQKTNRVYRKIYKRNHYLPKPCRRLRRYRERYDYLMSATIDPECPAVLVEEWENLKLPKSIVDYSQGRNS